MKMTQARWAKVKPLLLRESHNRSMQSYERGKTGNSDDGILEQIAVFEAGMSGECPMFPEWEKVARQFNEDGTVASS